MTLMLFEKKNMNLAEKTSSVIDMNELQESLAEAESIILASKVNNKFSDNIRNKYVPPKKLLLYLVRMGSFTSMPRIGPSENSNDDDENFSSLVEINSANNQEAILTHCSNQLKNLPPAIKRCWYSSLSSIATQLETKSNNLSEHFRSEGNMQIFRVLQWNVLSQALGTNTDNFKECSDETLNWKTRRFRMLEEIVRYSPDIICLQEVDHYNFLFRALQLLGYSGNFLPKPDSPCIYLKDNSGPDGCAIFYQNKRFRLELVAKKIIDVWNVPSNQVVLLNRLRCLQSEKTLCIATTHLKAKKGALLSTLRNEQGKSLLQFIENKSIPNDALICTGDFNAEPSEPVYNTMVSSDRIRLSSSYASLHNGQESAYTTWKIRKDAEYKETVDYIFFGPDELLQVYDTLEFPSGEQIGKKRLPNTAFASDHMSLVTDFRFR